MLTTLTRLRLWLANRLWLFRVGQTRRLLAGPRHWQALDTLGIPGFGVDLLRVDFPPDLNHPFDWTYAQTQLSELIGRNRDAQIELLRNLLLHAPDLAGFPLAPSDDDDVRPWLENPFLGLHDIVILHGLLLHLRPANYIEIGSGVSTRVAAMARARSSQPFKIHSFDPEPRATITGLCDHMEQSRLEHCIPRILELARPGDVVFFDGSHRAFPGSDVTLFFLNLLPRLPSGVIVHIHDIYLPFDYPRELQSRLWSEQYMLAAWMLGGAHGIEILMPVFDLFSRPEAKELIDPVLKVASPHRSVVLPTGCSFWLKKT